GGLVDGASVTWTVAAHIDPSYGDGDTLSNTASIATNETADPVSDNDSATSATTVERSADLQVTKTAAPDPATAGTDETFTVTVENLGPSDNAGYTVSDAVPAGTTFASASSGCSESAGIVSCTSGGLAAGTITCTSPGLANGDSVTWTVVVHIRSGYVAGSDLSNTASIATNATADQNAANDTSTATVKVKAQANVADLKVDTPDPVVAG